MKPTFRSDLIMIASAIIALGAFAALPFWLRSRVAVQPSPDQLAASVPLRHVSVLNGKLVFQDAQTQSREFMGYFNSIQLTPEQEEIKRRVLEPMPAACCRNSSAYSCCCPCNLSKTIWGLSNYAIARLGADENQLREAVYGWMSFVSPNGFSGEACYRGGCDGSFSSGGCGGMVEQDLNA